MRVLFLICLFSVTAFAQENDDLYFRAKDRVQENKNISLQYNENENPTDSYSARNINPEYVSRINSDQTNDDNSNYFIAGYLPINNAYNNTLNLNFNSGYHYNTFWNYHINSSYWMYDPWNYRWYDFYDFRWNWNYRSNFYYSNWWYRDSHIWYRNNNWNNWNNWNYVVINNNNTTTYNKRPSRNIIAQTPSQSNRPSRLTNSTNDRNRNDNYYIQPNRRNIESNVYQNTNTYQNRSRNLNNNYTTPARSNYNRSSSPSRSYTTPSYTTPTRSNNNNYTQPSRSNNNTARPTRGGN